ncbi:MAG: RNA methyltransferase [Acidobacteriota bacterium]|nr:RNA methyltransferase [Acidobacteriota bacterium]
MDRLPFRATPLASPYEGFSKLPVVILLDNVRSMYNVGSFFRTADAASAEKLLLTGITACPPQNAIHKTALGAEEAVCWEHAPDPLPFLDQLREQNYQIAAIETTPHAVDLFEWQAAFPVCIIFGHEVDGIRPAVGARCDVHIRIPMLGMKHSLNVATAGGVVLFELLRKYQQKRGTRA